MAAPVVATVSSTPGVAGVTSRAVNKPAGTTAGDTITIGVVSYDQDAYTHTCSGFTQRKQVVQTGISQKIGLTVLDRVADGSEGASFTVNISPACYTLLMCARITGATATPYDVSDGAVTTSSTLSLPGLTLGNADELILNFLAGYNFGYSSGLTGWTRDISSIDGVCDLFSKGFAASGATGGFSVVQGAAGGMAGISIAYKSTDGGTPPPATTPRLALLGVG